MTTVIASFRFTALAALRDSAIPASEWGIQAVSSSGSARVSVM